MKVCLILVDGMRPDALTLVPEAQEMIRASAYAPTAQTVMPSVTLPCHMSLFHSVDPARHGTTTNDYMPQVRPIPGLCEVLANGGKKCAMFYDWEQLRDLTRPGSLVYADFRRGGNVGYDVTNGILSDAAISYLGTGEADFAFVYMGYPDAAGHNHGWMSEEYLSAVQHCWKNIARIAQSLDTDWTVIVTADHGGHGRGHGADIPEDMTIPIMLHGTDFAPGTLLPQINIKDIAPTVAKLLGLAPAAEWEGKSLL